MFLLKDIIKKMGHTFYPILELSQMVISGIINQTGKTKKTPDKTGAFYQI